MLNDAKNAQKWKNLIVYDIVTELKNWVGDERIALPVWLTYNNGEAIKDIRFDDYSDIGEFFSEDGGSDRFAPIWRAYLTEIN